MYAWVMSHMCTSHFTYKNESCHTYEWVARVFLLRVSSVIKENMLYVLRHVAMCCSVLWCVLQCVAVCCGVLRCVAVCCGVLRFDVVCCGVPLCAQSPLKTKCAVHVC